MFERVPEVLEVSRILNGFHNDNPQLVNSHIDRNNLWERNMWKCFLSWQNMQNIIIALETLRSRTQSVDQSPTFWQFLQKSFHIFKRMSRWNFSVNAYLLCNISRVLILWRYSSNARLGTTTTSMTHYWLLPEVRWCVSDHFLWPLFFATTLAHLTRWPCTNQISLRKNIKFPSNQMLSKSNVWWWLVVYEKQLSH